MDTIEVDELNDFIAKFVKVYFSVGNLIPIWKGGNTKKGGFYNGFMDLLELFFKAYYKYYKALLNNEQAHLELFDDYMNKSELDFSLLSNFLNSVDTKEKYNKYVNHVVSVIINREALIKEIK